jgi:hypothetical protein
MMSRFAPAISPLLSGFSSYRGVRQKDLQGYWPVVDVAHGFIHGIGV